MTPIFPFSPRKWEDHVGEEHKGEQEGGHASEQSVHEGEQMLPTVPLTIDEMLQEISQPAKPPVTMAGFVASYCDNDGLVHRFRFETNSYIKARELRGNQFPVDLMLINLITKKTPDEQKEFLSYFQPLCESLSRLDETVGRLDQELHRVYVQRHVNHTFGKILSKKQHLFIEDLHRTVYCNKLRQQGEFVKTTDIQEYCYHLPNEQIMGLLGWGNGSSVGSVTKAPQ